MRSTTCAAFAAISLSCLVPASAVFAQSETATAIEPLPLSEYGKLPDVERTALSPSGDRHALITTINGERVLLAVENQTEPIRIVKVGDLKIRSIRWIGNDRILLVSSETQDLGWGFTTDKAEFALGTVIPIDDTGTTGVIFSKQKELYDSIRGIHGIREIGGKHYGYFGAIKFKKVRLQDSHKRDFMFDHGRPYLYRVDLETLDAELVQTAAPVNVGRDWLIDEKGEIAFRLDVGYNTGAWQIFNADGKKIAKGKQPRAGISLRGLSADGTRAIYRERGEERNYWYTIGQDGGTPEPFLDGVDWETILFEPSNGRMIGYTIGEGENERHVFADKALQEKAERVRKAFSAYESWMSGWTSDLSDVIVRTSGNGDSGTYYAVDLETSKANAIAYQRLAIEPKYVGKISTFEYKASDGMEMDGILTLPPGKEAKNLPVVIHPHGGPHSADAPVFDWWAQAFASRGYAVFQPNFRGSTNRDEAFKRAGYGEWGGKMQTDKSDGLKALADAGIVDPKRACIVGASYGGYAALAGVTLQQGLYRCAVAVAPVSDLRDMYNEDYKASGRDRTTKVALREQLGNPDNWNAVSPLKAAEQADAPIMLIHGIDDTVVPYSHSKKMADKLKDHDKPYEMVTLEGEDHWLSLSVTRQQMLENAVRWVEKYNPAD
ncbi:MAG: S9 family peptidase [Pseudomonadota bacterium]